ncbi:MAG: hypothetical protein ONB31_12320 [candidate division KSB1 bacterium]|nr:hypothetical protein [candidate division KSB1 bacterium]MDZ7336814.1 hypothetical protein [candidate division KSB1 bacterium]MDZ7358537.1 hypothetical protein [candidate division KSB1 bacterium]MDZ7402219.1 hypothetical protein [candidate division KSB1 bacterium]
MLAPLAQKVVITDAPGRKGKEFRDTTIYVNSELRLYAALYNNGKYKSEAKVDWLWADTTSHRFTASDTSQYLGFGSTIIFKPKKTGAGFIFVKNLPNAMGDSTGKITIITLEKLKITPAWSDKNTITQGQQNIPVYFEVENTGEFPIKVQEASLQFLKYDSILLSDQYLVHRIDTVTTIISNEKRRFEFLVDIEMDADTGRVSIDIQLMTGEAFYHGIEPKHVWEVQSPPLLVITQIEALTEQIFPGQQNVFVVMHVSNWGGATVGSLLASLNFWRNGQDVSNQYRSQMSELNPKTLPGWSSAQLHLIVQVDPTATYGTVVINGTITAQDLNTGIWHRDSGADRPGSWLVTQSLAQVGILSTRARCPNLDANGDGEVNLGQIFAVEVIVGNQGTDDLSSVVLSLRSDGTSKFLNGPKQVISRLNRFQVDTLTFAIEAWAEEIPSVEKWVARIDSAISVSGAKATISPAVDSLSQVKIFRPTRLILTVELEQTTVPIASSFEVMATVTHSPESSSFDNSGKLIIHLPQNYGLISGDSIRSFQSNGKVTWSINAPSYPSGPDTIAISILQLPKDRNDPSNFAQILKRTSWIVVHTVESTIDIVEVAIIEPIGAKDNIVSTDQLLQVRAKIRPELVENVTVHIIPPDGFEVLENNPKALKADSIAWWLRAPSYQSGWPQRLKIKALGNVNRDMDRIIMVVDSSLAILTVARANLKVMAKIIDPASAIQGRISPGLSFTIQGDIINSGQAGIYGACSLRLDLPDQRLFRVIGDSIIPWVDLPIVWTVSTSEQLDAVPRIIKIWLHETPLDENSDEEAWVADDHRVADVPVFVAANSLELQIHQLPGVGPKVLAPNISENMMAIEFKHLGNEIGFPISIQALKFDIEDERGNHIDPTTVMTKLKVLDGQITLGDAVSVSNNPVEVSMTSPITLEANEQRQIIIQVDCSQHLSKPFRIHLKDETSLSIQALLPIKFVDEFRNPISIFNLRSQCPVIIADDLKRSFLNYPNPFGTKDRPKTHFIYFLSKDSDIELEIYTLLGELVYRCQYSRAQPQGRRGLHQGEDLIWDGCNLLGYKVLNGVYVARIETSSGESALTRVAVIK